MEALPCGNGWKFRGGSRVGVQTPALLIRVPFFEKNLFFQNLLFREDEELLRTQTFVYVHTDLLTDTCFISCSKAPGDRCY